ncbi:P-loop containing nucleoside triphosphate hydrolase [Glarea lozoyensis ATCC 20868]|uniref:p-loop containing nucleoside triphosphate hydrolase n=1 Tax=Glarea lozoyensis (strain ATCC 20868 / MF5171) TaxID=1116229 RepID=S3CQG5_GLAL2|nr:P-loop containing nucleoside triphosphate hydrolase [Glarea lozoyensis ATCC 20868]EPE27935.1 P-loop containing nucleoside triphosphate hydrolase [Glarea lozoyensis ATCC 20868]
MAKVNLKSFQQVLQNPIQLEDRAWIFEVPNLPSPSKTNHDNLIKSISLVSNSTKNEITLKLQQHSPNRAIIGRLDQFISISFADFKLRVPIPTTDPTEEQRSKPATARESSDYIVRLLRSGIQLNNIHYNFYGHSNSQLKSRTCFLYAAPPPEISKLVESLGDFTKMKTVAKKSKRIGLLFSVAKAAMTLNPSRCQDIPDIEAQDYVFTDGCGLISKHLARELSRVLRVAFRNTRYTPSVFQIRYRGYKGVLMLDPGMEKQTWVKFRKSMKKFHGGDDHSFSVVEYSKPYGFGNLNDEVVLLLHSLGIPESTLLQKQAEHLKFLSDATKDSRSAFRFLTYTNKPELAEKVLIDGFETVQPTLTKLVNSEYDRMINKRDEQRCRILIPKSRLLFGICDAWGVLKEGECAVKVTMDGDGQPYTLKGMDVLVTRNPCLHPGDLQKFKAVERDELAHLVDCIVFPTRGARPAADLMSGGDLDGDTFFVCWDSDLIPEKVSEAAQYPGGKEAVSFKPITDDDRLVYFAKYTNASLGRVKNLYLDWARSKGPMSPECQQLNRLFSMCVDGNRIKVPSELESPPQPSPLDPPFILGILHNEAKDIIQARQRSTFDYDGFTFDAMELLMARENMAISEFELIKLTYKWCRKNKTDLTEFLHLFDLNLLTAEEKAWTLNQIPPSFEASSMISNALCQSNLLSSRELAPFKLNYPGLKWKCIYDSTRDRLATFLDVAARSLELFHRKLIVIQVDERLTLAIYVPQKVERAEECQVDNRVRLFAFPHSKGDETAYRLAVPTKKNYRLYCDSNMFQLFDLKKANTWVFINKGASDDSSYRNQETARGWRKGRQATLDSGRNFDCRASIALDKFSRRLQTHIGRVNRNGVLGAEIYVISNKDVKSMLNLDLWLEYVDTDQVMPLFEKNAKEYSVPKLKDVDWDEEPEYIKQIVKLKNYATFDSMDSGDSHTEIFGWLFEKSETGMLFDIFRYFMSSFTNEECTAISMIRLRSMVTFLERAPFLSAAFSRLESWAKLPSELHHLLQESSSTILKAPILSANTVGELVLQPFKKALAQIDSMSFDNFSDLMELMTLCVRSPDLALDLILECLEPETSRLLPGNAVSVQRFARNLFGIALDHIDEADESHKPESMLLDLRFCEATDTFPVVETRIRIDAPSGMFSASDHVRLTVANPPSNNVTAVPYSMDALVKSSQPGSASFTCFHPLPPFLEECSWEVKKCGSFVTSKTMIDAVRNFYSQNDNCCPIADEILGIKTLSPSAGEISAYKKIARLNDSQNQAVQTALEYPLVCLWGPPGTGKTHTIVEIIRQLQASGNRRILVTAPTHNAVDNVMRKYLEEAAKSSLLGAETPRPLRVSTDVRKVAPDLIQHTCDAMMGKELYTSYSALNKARDQIKRCNLIFTTCIGSGLGLLRSETFDTVIVDEASQQTEPASLVPLVKGCRKAILVGDHVQLGATVQKHAVLQGFDVSLFERLYKDAQEGSVAKVMLDTQYRMHSSICAFSSREFYDGKLKTGIPNTSRPLPPSAFPWPAGEKRMLFVECATPEELGGKSKRNKGQTELCHKICTLLNTIPPSSSSAPISPSIALLTPYTAQVLALKSLASLFPNVEVFSIDGFQGREADIVIFVTVRCNVHGEIGFLKDLRRLNVVLTRAKRGVIVIGNRATLGGGVVEEESTQIWRKLLNEMQRVEIEVEGGEKLNA